MAPPAYASRQSAGIIASLKDGYKKTPLRLKVRPRLLFVVVARAQTPTPTPTIDRWIAHLSPPLFALKPKQNKTNSSSTSSSCTPSRPEGYRCVAYRLPLSLFLVLRTNRNTRRRRRRKKKTPTPTRPRQTKNKTNTTNQKQPTVPLLPPGRQVPLQRLPRQLPGPRLLLRPDLGPAAAARPADSGRRVPRLGARARGRRLDPGKLSLAARRVELSGVDVYICVLML
jgi:hypothetical protein